MHVLLTLGTYYRYTIQVIIPNYTKICYTYNVYMYMYYTGDNTTVSSLHTLHPSCYF